MLSRFFHLRSSLKPFAAPSAKPTLPSPTGDSQTGAFARPHADYDRHSLATSGFDHYVEWNDDDDRFFVH